MEGEAPQWSVRVLLKIPLMGMKMRGREGDPKTLEAFLRIEAAEAKSPDAAQQQLVDTVKMADKRIGNDSGLQDFYETIDVLLGELSKDFKVSRPSWDEYFLQLARQAATRSTCLRRQVGAVLVRDKTAFAFQPRAFVPFITCAPKRLLTLRAEDFDAVVVFADAGLSPRWAYEAKRVGAEGMTIFYGVASI